MKISSTGKLCAWKSNSASVCKSLRVDIEAGFEAVERGECTDYDATSIKTLARRVKSRGRRRLAAERAKSVRQ
jgi:hypothetical protein